MLSFDACLRGLWKVLTWRLLISFACLQSYLSSLFCTYLNFVLEYVKCILYSFTMRLFVFPKKAYLSGTCDFLNTSKNNSLFLQICKWRLSAQLMNTNLIENGNFCMLHECWYYYCREKSLSLNIISINT